MGRKKMRFGVKDCERLGIKLKDGSEANQCLLCDFEETTFAKASAPYKQL